MRSRKTSTEARLKAEATKRTRKQLADDAITFDVTGWGNFCIRIPHYRLFSLYMPTARLDHQLQHGIDSLCCSSELHTSTSQRLALLARTRQRSVQSLLRSSSTRPPRLLFLRAQKTSRGRWFTDEWPACAKLEKHRQQPLNSLFLPHNDALYLSRKAETFDHLLSRLDRLIASGPA